MLTGRIWGGPRLRMSKRVDIIVLDSGQGRVRTLNVPRKALVCALSVVALCCVFSALLSWRHFEGGLLDARAIGLWNQRLGAQRAELDELSSRAQSELLQVGQKLASMEARLLRMEALGERVSQMAQLTDGEFRFNEPPALGGPASSLRAAALVPARRGAAGLRERAKGGSSKSS